MTASSQVISGAENGRGARTTRPRRRRPIAGEGGAGHVPIPVITINSRSKKVPRDPALDLRLAQAHKNPTSQDAADLLCDLAAEGRLSLIKKLVDESHIDLNVRESTAKATCFHAAAYEGRLNVIRYLIRMKADVDVKDVDGRTPLHLAVARNHEAAVILLIQKGKAEVLLEDVDNNTPLGLAITRNLPMSMVKALISEAPRAANPIIVYSQGDTIAHLAVRSNRLDVLIYMIEDLGVSPNQKTIHARTILHTAVQNGHLSIVQWLVEKKKADVTKVDHAGIMPHHYAVLKGHIDILFWLVSVGGAPIDAPAGARGDTGLHIAATQGQVGVVRWLIEEANAKLTALNARGETALNIAASASNYELLEYLKEQQKKHKLKKRHKAGGGGGEGGPTNHPQKDATLLDLLEGKGRGGAVAVTKKAHPCTSPIPAAPVPPSLQKGESINGNWEAKLEETEEEAAARKARNQKRREKAKKKKARKSGGASSMDVMGAGGVGIDEEEEEGVIENAGGDDGGGIQADVADEGFVSQHEGAGAVDEEMTELSQIEAGLVSMAIGGSGGEEEVEGSPIAHLEQEEEEELQEETKEDVEQGLEVPKGGEEEGDAAAAEQQTVTEEQEDVGGPPTAETNDGSTSRDDDADNAPEDLVCPVSLVLMDDPVLAPDGLTYQREALQAHIDFSAQKGKPLRSPVTGMPMDPIFFPNVVIRRMVIDFLQKRQRTRREEGQGGGGGGAGAAAGGGGGGAR